MLDIIQGSLKACASVRLHNRPNRPINLTAVINDKEGWLLKMLYNCYKVLVDLLYITFTAYK
jgi:hypothetical protein